LHMLPDKADDVRRVEHALAVVVWERSALGQRRDSRTGARRKDKTTGPRKNLRSRRRLMARRPSKPRDAARGLVRGPVGPICPVWRGSLGVRGRHPSTTRAPFGRRNDYEKDYPEGGAGQTCTRKGGTIGMKSRDFPESVIRTGRFVDGAGRRSRGRDRGGPRCPERG
jgi:hypothetical protein